MIAALFVALPSNFDMIAAFSGWGFADSLEQM